VHARLVFLAMQARQRRHARAALAALWVLAGGFAAARVRAIGPVFTIDSPGSGVAGQVRVTGRVAPQTIRQPLWLFVGSEAASCAPIEKVPIVIAPDGRWESSAELKGARGAHFWLSVVLSPEPGRASDEERIPEWLSRHAPEEQGGRGCRRRSHADWRPRADATVLASFTLTLTEDHALDEVSPRLDAIRIFDPSRNNRTRRGRRY
jgi:hypothetical protein